MTSKEYRKQELERFYDSQTSIMNENHDTFTLSKGVRCKRVNMSSEEYIDNLNISFS